MFSGFGQSSAEAAPPPPYSNDQSSPGTSLNSILPTPARRLQCALLILLCTDVQRKAIVDTFELPAPSSRGKNKEPGLQSGNGEVSYADRERNRAYQVQRRKQELAEFDTLTLRKAALAHFDSWRAKILRRTCDALGVRAENVRMARKQYQAQEAKRQPVSEQEDLIQWAIDQDVPKDEAKQNPRYPRTSTELIKMQEEQRVLLLECLVLLFLSLESYSAHSRVLLLHITSSLKLEVSTLVHHESQVAQGLLTAASHMSAEEAKKNRAAENSAASRWKVGLAAVGGAVLLGVTGGLAAPLLAAGLGTIFGGLGLGAVSTLLGALASNTVLIAGLFGAYGGKMTGEMMERYEKEVEDFRFLPVRHSLADTLDQGRPRASRTPSGAEEKRHKLRVAIGISGSLTTEGDMIVPWSILNRDSVESFALRWEVAALLRLGVSLSSVLKSYAWQYAKWELARRTVFHAVAAGLWPLGLLKMAKIIDNPFSVARARADKAGKVLADALIDKCQGERPVTLIGYSVGARVIYSCLLELADRKAFGLVEDVVLMGAPAPSDSEPWTKIRSVVSGRVVNCYSTEDYILGFLYRASSAQFDVAGLQAVEMVNGVENYDLSAHVQGHTRYRYMIGQNLQKIDFDDVDPSEVEKEYAILKALDNQEKELEQQQGEAPAYDESDRIESSVRDRVGSPAQVANTDEAEERRRREIMRAAEEREAASRGPPPAYQDMPSKSSSAMSQATRRPEAARSSAAPGESTESLADDVQQLHVHDDNDRRSVISEGESVASGPLEMLHVAPVPEDYDEDDGR